MITLHWLHVLIKWLGRMNEMMNLIERDICAQFFVNSLKEAKLEMKY